jgi:phosphohistidine phosphatase SixA
MRASFKFGISLLAAILTTLAAPLAMASESSGQAQDKRSLVLLLRHALAPGGGDPANFDVNDCRTQRNLNDQGREQSRQIGQQIKKLGLKPTHVWSSQWCRSWDTAVLMDVGEVKALPYLNSYFQNRAAGPAQMADLRQFLAQLDPHGGPYVMSSHQVVVSAISDQWVNSGDGIWLVLTGDKDHPWKIYPALTNNLALPPGF